MVYLYCFIVMNTLLCFFATAAMFKNSKRSLKQRFLNITYLGALHVTWSTILIFLLSSFFYIVVSHIAGTTDVGVIAFIITFVIAMVTLIIYTQSSIDEYAPCQPYLSIILFLQSKSKRFKVALIITSVVAVISSIFLASNNLLLLIPAATSYILSFAGAIFTLNFNASEKKIHAWAMSEQYLCEPFDHSPLNNMLDFLFLHNLEAALDRANFEDFLLTDETKRMIEEKIRSKGEICDILNSDLPDCMKSHAMKMLSS